jgi:hypothetical protein
MPTASESIGNVASGIVNWSIARQGNIQNDVCFVVPTQKRKILFVLLEQLVLLLLLLLLLLLYYLSNIVGYRDFVDAVVDVEAVMFAASLEAGTHQTHTSCSKMIVAAEDTFQSFESSLETKDHHFDSY